MPLIDDEMIDSLKDKQGRWRGRWSPFSLYLLGALPKYFAGRNWAKHEIPAQRDWRPGIITTKITGERLRTIRNHAARLQKEEA